MNKSILKLAIPNIISNITIPLLSMVDMILMGHLESASYIGAIALGGTIFSVLYSFFSFLRAGTTGFTAQALGSGDKTETIYSLYRSVCIGIPIIIFILSMQIPIAKLSSLLLDGSEEVKQLAISYFYIRIWAAPANIMLYCLNGWFVGMQNTKIPMFIAILINVMNIVFSIFFVLILNKNVTGVALGTVIAQYSGLTLAIVMLIKNYKSYFIKINKNILFDFSKIKRFFKVNTDLMIRSFLLIISIAFFTNQSAKLGDNILAVNMILLQSFYIFSYFTDGFAYAGEALVGKYVGSKDRNNLVKAIRLLLLWGFSISVPFTILYAIFPSTFVRIISDNPNILLEVKPYYIYMIVIPIITFAAFIWDGIYIGATASKAIRNTMIISTIFVFLPAWYLLTPKFGNHGLWIAFLCFMIARGVSMSVMAKNNIIQPIKNQ
ncbi:MAG: MATE family efflux transporter [Bacteroidales bacterium]|nr:MATE family efflux transporter [Bacteroidales bacterium]